MLLFMLKCSLSSLLMARHLLNFLLFRSDLFFKLLDLVSFLHLLRGFLLLPFLLLL